jgi:uncharacterized membrane protein YkvA (DUF1232 family)
MNAGDDERHPLKRLGGTLSRLPRYLKLGALLLADASLSRRRKAVLAAAAAYAVSPIDLVPGIIPVVGQLDDLAVLLLALRLALGGLPPTTAAAHLAAAGLSSAALDEDVATVRATAGWVAKGAGRTALRAATLSATGLRSTASGVRFAADGVRRATQRLRQPR